MRKLRELRRERHLTLRDLEAISGVDHSSIGKIENGEHLPNLGTLLKLAKALEVSLDDLIDEEEALELVK